MGRSLFLSADMFGGTGLFDSDQLFGLDDIAPRPLTGHANWQDDADWFDSDRLAGQPAYVAPTGVLPTSLVLTSLLLGAWVESPWPASASAGSSLSHPYKGEPLFVRADLALTGFWKASYPGSPPWPATASGGSSGGNGGLLTTGNDPTGGTAQNGLTPADFNGTTQALVTSNAMNTFIADGAGTVWVLFCADTAGADAGAGGRVDNQGIVFQDGGGVTWGISFSTAGITALIYDGVSYKERTIACPADGTYRLAIMRWDGVNIELRLGATDSGQLACGDCTANAGTMVVGRNYSVVFFDGRVLEIGMTNTKLGDTQCDNLLVEITSDYAL